MMQRRSNTLQTGETKSRHSRANAALVRAEADTFTAGEKKSGGKKKTPAEAIFKRPSGSLHTGLRAESERINRRENIWYILSRAEPQRRDAAPRSAARNAVSSLRESPARNVVVFFLPKRPVSSKPQSTSAIYTNKSSPLV